MAVSSTGSDMPSQTVLLGCIADDLTGGFDLADILARSDAPVSLRLGVPSGSTEAAQPWRWLLSRSALPALKPWLRPSLGRRGLAAALVPSGSTTRSSTARQQATPARWPRPCCLSYLLTRPHLLSCLTVEQPLCLHGTSVRWRPPAG